MNAIAPTRRGLMAGAAGTAAMLWAAPAFAAGAIKHYILIELLPGADQLALDRWYMTYHAPQVRRAYQAWQRDYLSFRAYLPPAEAAQRYKVAYGRMTEIHFDTLEDFRESRKNPLYGGDLQSFTPPPGGWRANILFRSTTATVPVNPDTLYVSKPTPPKELPYLRWIVFLRPPADVAQGLADAWFDGVHAKELAALPGLKRFGLYRSVADRGEYSRVMELWFDDYAAWRAAFLTPEPRFAAPPWGGKFPFFDTLSMFVGENPDVDFIHDDRVIP